MLFAYETERLLLKIIKPDQADAVDVYKRQTPDTSKADTSSEVSEPAEDTGKVLNIYCWNEEFKSRITAHYPDYNEVDRCV